MARLKVKHLFSSSEGQWRPLLSLSRNDSTCFSQEVSLGRAEPVSLQRSDTAALSARRPSRRTSTYLRAVNTLILLFLIGLKSNVRIISGLFLQKTSRFSCVTCSESVPCQR